MTKTMIVTGGGRGIGAAIARAAAKQGFFIAINYLSDEISAPRTVAAINAAGGVIDTSLHEIHRGADTVAAVAKTVPLGHAGSPEEVADAVLWFANDASSYVHGALIDVTGGR